jgi:hypothetical protein
MDDLKLRLDAAKSAGIEIDVMPLANGDIAVVAPGDYFMLLPEDLNESNTWYCGSKDRACAFVEGLLVGAKWARPGAQATDAGDKANSGNAAE